MFAKGNLTPCSASLRAWEGQHGVEVRVDSLNAWPFGVPRRGQHDEGGGRTTVCWQRGEEALVLGDRQEPTPGLVVRGMVGAQPVQVAMEKPIPLCKLQGRSQYHQLFMDGVVVRILSLTLPDVGFLYVVRQRVYVDVFTQYAQEVATLCDVAVDGSLRALLAFASRDEAREHVH